jgi:pimeloyl-ACP methyl ester carboxylesterase
VLLVHSWTGDQSYFEPQITHFKRAHRVLAVDLRGHGQSDKPTGAYSPEVFRDDLAWMCDHLGVRHALLVGHSMGGNIVLELAARRPDLVAALILLDAPVFPPAALLDAMKAAAADFRGPDYAEAARQFVDGVFLPTDRVRRAEILDKTAHCPQHVLSPSWEQSCVNYDASAAARACRVPVCYIGAATPLADLNRFQELCPRLVIGRTIGAGHFHQLEVPDQVHAMIDRFLLIELGRPA